MNEYLSTVVWSSSQDSWDCVVTNCHKKVSLRHTWCKLWETSFCHTTVHAWICWLQHLLHFQKWQIIKNKQYKTVILIISHVVSEWKKQNDVIKNDGNYVTKNDVEEKYISLHIHVKYVKLHAKQNDSLNITDSLPTKIVNLKYWLEISCTNSISD